MKKKKPPTPIRLRPNTCNNERRLTNAKLVIEEAGVPDPLHKRTALRDLRTWSLEPTGRNEIFRQPAIWSKVVKGAMPDQHPGVKFEALGVMKNVSLAAGGPASRTPQGSVRLEMWNDKHGARLGIIENLAPDVPVRVREMAMGVLANLVSETVIQKACMGERQCMQWVVDAARNCKDTSATLRKQALRVLRSLSLDAGNQRQIYADKKGCREVVFAGAMGKEGASRNSTV